MSNKRTKEDVLFETHVISRKDKTVIVFMTAQTLKEAHSYGILLKKMYPDHDIDIVRKS